MISLITAINNAPAMWIWTIASIIFAVMSHYGFKEKEVNKKEAIPFSQPILSELPISSDAKYCPNCGTEIGERSKFCGGCGAKIGVLPANAVAQETETGNLLPEKTPTPIVNTADNVLRKIAITLGVIFIVAVVMKAFGVFPEYRNGHWETNRDSAFVGSTATKPAAVTVPSSDEVNQALQKDRVEASGEDARDKAFKNAQRERDLEDLE